MQKVIPIAAGLGGRKTMKIIFAKEIGFCFGAKKALKMVEDNLPKLKKPIKMYGSLVHNEQVAKHLKRMGIEIIIDDFKKIKKGTLIITAHGISPTIKNELRRKPDLDLLDTTCPIVALAQKTAELLEKENREVLIFGDPKHVEVLGIKGAAKEKATIFEEVRKGSVLSSLEAKEFNLVTEVLEGAYLKEMKDLETRTEAGNIGLGESARHPYGHARPVGRRSRQSHGCARRPGIPATAPAFSCMRARRR